MSEDYRRRFACKVCGNWPDEEGVLEHGKGCYMLEEDGGGSELIEESLWPCATCDGTGRVWGDSGDGTGVPNALCPECDGTGVVREL